MSKVEVKSKIPPHSTDAERSILGALLLDRDAVISVIEFLKPEHFYEDKHRRIFEVILQLYQEREPVDVVTVSEKLKKSKALTEIGGMPLLADLVNSVPTAAHAEHYAHLVKDMYTKRQLISTATRILEMGFDDSGDVRQILDEAEQKVFSLAQQHLRQVFVPVKDIWPNLLTAWTNYTNLPETCGVYPRVLPIWTTHWPACKTAIY